jgi:hypothetical protein
VRPRSALAIFTCEEWDCGTVVPRPIEDIRDCGTAVPRPIEKICCTTEIFATRRARGGSPAARGKEDTVKTTKGSLNRCRTCACGESVVYFRSARITTPLKGYNSLQLRRSI